jgi:hypothetical protein
MFFFAIYCLWFNTVGYSLTTISDWWCGTWILWLSIQLGMSSSQLTHIFQRGRSTTNQVRSPYHRLRTDRMVDQADHQWIGHVRGAYRAGTVAALHCCHGWWIDREKGAWPCYFDNEFPGLKRISIGDP